MRKFGLIGGTSWHSTVEYTPTSTNVSMTISETTRPPPLRLVSLNQKQIHDLQRADDWDAIAHIYIAAALNKMRCSEAIVQYILH
ncbi:MAG: hypothetical protein R3E93_14425 [Thiothrix sp.]